MHLHSKTKTLCFAMIVTCVSMQNILAQSTDIRPAIQGTRSLYAPSTSQLEKDILDFQFNHRFGNAKNTSEDFLGLDNGANTQLALSYGIMDRLSVGLSRVSLKKTYELSSKVSLLEQTQSTPLSLSIYAGMGIETQEQYVEYGPYIVPPKTGLPALDSIIQTQANRDKLTLADRTSHVIFVPISHRFSDTWSIQIAPVFVHRNFVKSTLSNDRAGVNLSIHFNLSKNISLIFETVASQKRDYIGNRYEDEDKKMQYDLVALTPDEINLNYNLGNPDDFRDVYLRNVYLDKKVPYYSTPASLGISYNSGGHQYHVFISNSRNLAYTKSLVGAEYDYRKKDWTIGFNITRYFSFESEASEDDF